MSEGLGALEHGDDARCYAEPYEPGDAQRVLEILNELREDGCSSITIANSTGMERATVEQILLDLRSDGRARYVNNRRGVVLWFPPLTRYDPMAEDVTPDRPKEPVLETPTRHKCLVPWCKHLIDKKGQAMRDHLIRTHNIPADIAQHAQDLLDEGKRIDLEAPRFICRHCGEDRESRAAHARHEPYCRANPDYQANVDEMRKRKYGPNAILGELTAEKFERRGVTCPVCGLTSTGQGCYQRTLKHIRVKHSKSAEEARDVLRTMTWGGEAAAVKESAEEPFVPMLIVRLAPDREMQFALSDELYDVFSRGYERTAKTEGPRDGTA